MPKPFKTPIHYPSPRVARKGHGRPRHNRPAITLGNTIWEVAKIAGDKPSGEGRILKV